LAVSLVVAGSPMAGPAGRALAQAAASKPAATDTMVKDVVTLDSEINACKSTISQLQSKSEALGARIQALGPQIAQNQSRLSAKRKALSARARSMYVNGRYNTLEMLVTSKGVNDFFERKDMLAQVAAKDAQLIGEVKTQAAQLQASMTELKQSKKEVDQAGAEATSRQQRLESARAEKSALIAKAGAQSSAVVAQSNTVESKISQINPPSSGQTIVTGRPTGNVMIMVASGYSPQEPGLDDHTASGMKAQHGVVAVDPRVIPLGTRLNVEGYGNCIAGDTGSAIKGNRIDLCFDTLAECNAYGMRKVRVEILNWRANL
jgi:cystine transport system substrate-binding protein